MARSSAPPSAVTASPTTGRTGRCWQSAASPAALLRSIESSVTTTPDQWQAQIQARIQSRARVLVHAGFLSDDELAEAHLEPAADIGETVSELVHSIGPSARVCVLPEGPQTIAYAR